jgi:phage terminase small subunit
MSRASQGLNPKQLRFVEEYLIDLNATQAAIRSGYAQPHSQGPRLLENVGVQSAIAKAQAKRSERLQIDADWVLKRLGVEVEADLADLYEDDGKLKPVKKWPLIWRQGLVAGIEVEEVGDNGERVTVRKIKLSDRIKRLELIGKHVNVQAFREQVEHKGAINLTINQDDAEL